MDDELCRRFFVEPEETYHRRYEALRAFFVEGRSLDETAAQFGYRQPALKSVISRFRAGCRKGSSPPFFFRTDGDDLPADDIVKTSTDPNCPKLPTAAN
jgi:hypothetical protein